MGFGIWDISGKKEKEKNMCGSECRPSRIQSHLSCTMNYPYDIFSEVA